VSSHTRRQHFFIKNSLHGRSLTQILIYANLILFTLMALHGILIGLGMGTILQPTSGLLGHWGAQFWPYVIKYDQWWRCITYAYTHGGIIHLGFNMVVLYQVGPLLEAEIGWSRLFSVYTLSALLATIAGYFWHFDALVVGASGSIFGLIGFSISFYHRSGGSLAIQRRNFMFQWAVMAFVFGIVVGADNAAHFGGLVAGLLLGWFMPLTVRKQKMADPLFRGIALVCAVLTVLSVIFMFLSWL
jgi:rhomboid protease GluP